MSVLLHGVVKSLQVFCSHSSLKGKHFIVGCIYISIVTKIALALIHAQGQPKVYVKKMEIGNVAVVY